MLFQSYKCLYIRVHVISILHVLYAYRFMLFPSHTFLQIQVHVISFLHIFIHTCSCYFYAYIFMFFFSLTHFIHTGSCYFHSFTFFIHTSANYFSLTHFYTLHILVHVISFFIHFSYRYNSHLQYIKVPYVSGSFSQGSRVLTVGFNVHGDICATTYSKIPVLEVNPLHSCLPVLL